MNNKLLVPFIIKDEQIARRNKVVTFEYGDESYSELSDEDVENITDRKYTKLLVGYSKVKIDSKEDDGLDRTLQFTCINDEQDVVNHCGETAGYSQSHLAQNCKTYAHGSEAADFPEED